MLTFLNNLRESINTNVGQSINPERVAYSFMVIIPLNIIAEIFFFLNTYIFSILFAPFRFFLKMKRNPYSVYAIAIIVRFYFPFREIKNEYSFYISAGVFTLVAFLASRKNLVAKNSAVCLAAEVNKLVTSLIILFYHSWAPKRTGLHLFGLPS
jgi:hypothetical protein